MVLGAADRYRAFLNFRLKATLVEIERFGTVNVLLLREGADGQPVLEDVTGALAVAAGRAPWDRLEGLSLDAAHFSSQGRIALRPDAGDVASARGVRAAKVNSVPDEVVIDLGEQIAVSSRLQSPARRETGQ
jgi:hypothetical protein